jgi:hypothetical protein
VPPPLPALLSLYGIIVDDIRRHFHLVF